MNRYLTLGLAVAVSACEPPAPTTSPSMSHGSHTVARLGISAATEQQIDKLRGATARFHDFDAAAAAGWGAQITGCFSDPQLGGMGFHYGNPALIDGTVEALKPELLLYEPQKNGKLRFVAVEYIVPFDAWTDVNPPTLFGQSFHRNEGFKLWVLHVWHFRHNRTGMFSDWNPVVSCKYAS